MVCICDEKKTIKNTTPECDWKRLYLFMKDWKSAKHRRGEISRSLFSLLLFTLKTDVSEKLLKYLQDSHRTLFV